MKQRILVTSIGSKIPLLKTLRRAKDSFDTSIQIIGADTNPHVLGVYFVDIFWEMPKLEHFSIEILLEYTKEHNVHYIIPTRDAELIFFARLKNILKQNGIYVFVADEASVLYCYDKLYFYENAKKTWVIPTSLDINKLQADSFVVKERFGAGGKSILCNVSREEANNYSKSLQEPIFQPFIEGREYSIDCYVDTNMKCRGVIVRSRDVVIDGESKITTVVHDTLLEQKAAEFVTCHMIQGHSVLQVLQNDHSSILIECNARFGGASTLSDHIGLKSFLWFLKEANNEDFQVTITQEIIKQVRIQEDYYFES